MVDLEILQNQEILEVLAAELAKTPAPFLVVINLQHLHFLLVMVILADNPLEVIKRLAAVALVVVQQQ